MNCFNLSPDDIMIHDGMDMEQNDRNVVIRDKNGVPEEWTLLHLGENPFVKNGVKGVINLNGDDLDEIVRYFNEKGELIPVDSHHYLHHLSITNNMDESDVLKFIPDGVAAMGFGTLRRCGAHLRFRVKWNPSAYKLLMEKIFRYFSPVIRGLSGGPLRITSVALENQPAINNLDALAASAESISVSGTSPELNKNQQEKEMSMTQVEQALCRLLQVDTLQLSAETPDGNETLVQAIGEKAELIGEFKRSLQLEENVPDSVLVIALKNLIENADGKEALLAQINELQKENESFRAERDQKRHQDLIRSGLQSGKITPATESWWKKLDVEQLAAHLEQAPVMIPQGTLPLSSLKEMEQPSCHLTEEDKTVCRHFGFTEEDFLAHKAALKQ